MRRRPTQPLAGVLAAAVVAGVASCSTPADPMDEPGSTPAAQQGPVEQVDPCAMLNARQLRRVVGRPVEVTGGAWSPASVPTFRCELGTRSGESLLAVTLAQGPVSQRVFTEAYGGRAVRGLGGPAVEQRTSDARVVRVLVGASVLSVESSTRWSGAPARSRQVRLTKALVDQVPGNPQVVAPRDGGCPRVSPARLTSVLGVPVRQTSAIAGSDGSLSCSWAGLPGSVSYVRLTGRAAVDGVSLALQGDRVTTVRGVAGSGVASIDVRSRIDAPGDLYLVSGDRADVLQVTPAAGWSYDGEPTTPAEKRLFSTLVSP